MQVSANQGESNTRQTPLPIPSNLWRVLDPRVLSNRLIMLFAAAATIGIGIYRLANGANPRDAVIQAVGVGVFAVLAWALGRELDPDHNLPAYTAAVLGVLAVLILGMPNLLLTGAVIAMLRLVNRTTGLPARVSDSLVLIALVGVVVARDGFWVIGAVVAVAFLLNALLIQPDRPNSFYFALLTLLVTVAAAVLFPTSEWTLRFDSTLGGSIAIAALAYLVIVLRDPIKLQSVGDWTGRPLSHQRVQAAQLLALAAALAVLLWDYTFGLMAVSPLWAAIVGVIVRRAVQILHD
jgi:hypothetical protein